ncbi:hypothetical protein DM02DRAFT_479424, partial [Periconia macrospinosa]
ITVGGGGNLSFNPASVTAATGTTIRFDFVSGNHSLTRSSLNDPCQNSGLFDTGFAQHNPVEIKGKFLVDYVVNSTESQWFYCSQQNPRSHCRSGMVFSLNPRDKQDEFVRDAL